MEQLGLDAVEAWNLVNSGTRANEVVVCLAAAIEDAAGASRNDLAVFLVGGVLPADMTADTAIG